MKSYQLKTHEALILNKALSESPIISEFIFELIKVSGMNPQNTRLSSAFVLVDNTPEESDDKNPTEEPEQVL